MRFRTLALATLPALLASVPLAAHAAGIPFFGPIIPASAATCAGGFGLILTVVNNVISLLITLAIVFVAPLSIGYAGFLMVVNPTSAGDIQKGKSIIVNTVVGIVIALAAWLIVGAVMNVLYKGTLPAWETIIHGNTADFCIPLPKGGTTPSTSGTQTPGLSASSAEEAAVRAQLAAAGVAINHDPCPAGSDGSGCTNVGGMQTATVNQIIIISNSCGGGITVTGGTEPGHAPGTYSHGNGYKVDLRLTDTLDACLQSMTSIGTRIGDGPGPAYADSCGENQYVKESDHWDITVKSACSVLK